jgi:flagellar motor switch protein FliN/FliY
MVEIEGTPGADAATARSPGGQPRGTPEDASPLAAATRGNLDLIMRIPVSIQVILGTATMPVASLMKLGRGAVIALDSRVGEAVDVVVNGRLVARGEVVIVDEATSRLGVSLIEIVGPATAGVASARSG